VKVFLRSSGGIGNIQIQGEVDTADLPPELAQRAEELLTPDRLRASKGSENPQFADAQQISIRVSSPQGHSEVEVDESAAPPELVDLCNVLIHEIVRRRAAKG
jgi:hypothetical protein